MRYVNGGEEGELGQDSFLDVVANVVGVLIILVMLIGSQATQSLLRASKSQAPIDSDLQLAYLSESPVNEDRVSQLTEELDKVTQQTLFQQKRTEEAVTNIYQVSQAAAAQDSHRSELAEVRAFVEEDLERRRSQLSSQSQKEFDTQRQLKEAQIRLDRLSKQQMSLLSEPGEVEELEIMPTPIAKHIDHESIYLCVRLGRVSVLRYVELMSKQNEAHENIRSQLHRNGQVQLTLGPIEGYRMRLTAVLMGEENGVSGPLAGVTKARKKPVVRYEFLPVSDQIGENIEQALQFGSKLMEYLGTVSKRKPSVVVLLYTDSFEEFRPLKKHLVEKGFPIATAPMEMHQTISFAPGGNPIVAQ